MSAAYSFSIQNQFASLNIICFWNAIIYVHMPKQTHLNQVESEYKDKLEKEVSARKELEKVCILASTCFACNN